MAFVLKIEITTKNTAGSGTIHPLYFSGIYDAGPNLAQLGGGLTAPGQTSTNTYNAPAEAFSVHSLAVRLNGLAPSASDNWVTSHVKVTFANEVLVDRPWELVFNEQNRSHELYRLAFDATRNGRDDDGGDGCR